jgi:hypothetical protein
MMREDQDARKAVLKSRGKGSPSNGGNRATVDPTILRSIQEKSRKLGEIDRKNRARLQQIVATVGWPGTTLVGSDGAHAAWLLVQHADADPPFQKSCLALMRGARKGEVAAIDVAYLTDRVRVAEGKKQLYGTQLEHDFTPQPIEDVENVDRRRAEAGLPPLADYLKEAKRMYEKWSGE